VQAKSFLKFLLLIALATVLSSLTVVFGSVPMRVCRRTFGRLAFWFGHLLAAGAMLAAGLDALALAFFATAVLTGVFSEIEEHGGSLFTASATSLLATAGAGALAFGGWLHITKTNFAEMAKTQLAPLTERLAELNPQVQLDVDTILRQLPSGLAIMAMISLVVALVWERRVCSWFKLNRPAPILDLSSFRVPDLTVWLAMIVILGAFLHHGIAWLETASVNALNILVVVYFFQGLAVVARAFRVFRVSPIWQAIWYVVIVLQLFLLVSFVGFADYWLEFRERLTRKPAESNKGI
jgi:hypothetical protein